DVIELAKIQRVSQHRSDAGNLVQAICRKQGGNFSGGVETQRGIRRTAVKSQHVSEEASCARGSREVAVAALSICRLEDEVAKARQGEITIVLRHVAICVVRLSEEDDLCCMRVVVGALEAVQAQPVFEAKRKLGFSWRDWRDSPVAKKEPVVDSVGPRTAELDAQSVTATEGIVDAPLHQAGAVDAVVAHYPGRRHRLSAGRSADTAAHAAPTLELGSAPGRAAGATLRARGHRLHKPLQELR